MNAYSSSRTGSEEKVHAAMELKNFHISTGINQIILCGEKGDVLDG